MSELQFFLFGAPRLEQDGEPVDISLRKALALLAYLAVTRQSHSRDALATLFWPDDDQSKARGNLRRALSRINSALGKGWLETNREQAGLDLKADLWLDVDHFQHRLAECRTHGHPQNEVCIDCIPLLTEVVSSYTDDFLAGFTLPDCPDFDEWQFFQSESLRQALASALERLVQGLNAQGDYESAIPHARRWLALDPLHEPAHQQLMELYAYDGQQAAALRQYNECVRILDEELGISPSEETTALYEAIKAKRLTLPIEAGEQRSRGVEESVKPSPLPPRSPAPPHNLPLQPTPFIGREAELATLDDLIANPDVRLVTIVGPGGMGKTRLAIQAATQSLNAFADGVWFVPLAPISSDEFLVAAIAEALDISFYGATDPKAQLLQQLRNKERLLILDNFEHVLEGAILLSEMVLAAPGLKLLVTSREYLNLQEEWRYDLQGLVFPATTDTPPSREGLGEGELPAQNKGDVPKSALLEKEEPTPTPALPLKGGGGEYSALQLFGQRAQQVQANFDPDAEYPAVVRICQLVDGMPLGLELAATWVKLMSCQEIAVEIEKNLDFLATSMRNVTERHRSLRAVFRHSWQLLSNEEQETFKKLSVFQGGFTREAAGQVAGASLPLLASLVDKSLLRRNSRYEIHELLRQYAAEKLQEAGEGEAIQERHSLFYTDFLQKCLPDLKGGRQLEATRVISTDIDNIRAAWQWAVAHEDEAAIAKSWESLFLYYDRFAINYTEGEAAFRQALTAVDTPAVMEEDKPQTTQRAILSGLLVGGLAVFCFRQGRVDEAMSLCQQSVSSLRQIGREAQPALAQALYWFSGTRTSKGEYAAASQNSEESLAIFSEVGDQFNQTLCIGNRGYLAEVQGNYTEALSLYRRSIEMRQQLGEVVHKLLTINALGRVTLALGDYAEARKQLEAGLQQRREIGHRFGQAGSLAALGELALVEGNLEQAKGYFQESFQLSQELNVSVYLGFSLTGLGSVARLQGAFEQAEHLYQESLTLWQREGNPREIAASLNHLGRLAFDQKAYTRAEQLHQESLAIVQELNHPYQLASTLRFLGHVALSHDKYLEARQYFRQALEITLQTKVAPIALDVLRGWAALLMTDEQSNKEIVQAIELLTLAEHHSASEYETKERARRLLAEWTDTLPPNKMASTQMRGRTLDLWETATNLLEALTTQDWDDSPRPSTSPQNLPPQPTPFIGREKELAALDDLIANPDVRLITIVGPGGMGKTRLALAAAERQLDTNRFSNGVYFVGLASLSSVDHIIPTIAEALSFPLDTGEQQTRTPKQQILDYLRQKRMLIVMDNFEHLLTPPTSPPQGGAKGGEELLVDILQAAPEVQILTTSRERLQLHEEQVYSIRGLEFPDAEMTKGVADYDAIKLFLQSARRVRSDFELEADDLTEVTRICHLVEGLPLGLELAASWVDMLSLADIAIEIQQSLDFLKTEVRNIPERHRSMRAVFDTTWQRLSEAERDVFAQLSVFRGGFTRQAAQEVTGASLRLLATLGNKSLLRYSKSRDRYEIHELLHQYGAEKLAAQTPSPQPSPTGRGSSTSPPVGGTEGGQDARNRHSAYYCAALHQLETDLKGSRQQEAIVEIEADIENVRTAWEWAVAQGQVERLEQTIESLGIFYEWRGYFQEGEAAFRLAAQQLATTESAKSQHSLAKLLAWQVLLSWQSGQLDQQADQILQQSLALLDSPQLVNQDTRRTRAFILLQMGNLAVDSDLEEGKRLFEQSLTFYRALDDRRGMAQALGRLTKVAINVGELDQAQQLCQESIAIWQMLGDQKEEGLQLVYLGFILKDKGQLDKAEELQRQNLAIFRAMDDRPAVSQTLYGLALTLSWTGRFIEAQPLLMESLQINDDLGSRSGSAHIYDELNHVEMMLGRYSQARIYAKKALTVFREIGNTRMAGIDLLSLGQIALAEESYSEARQFLQEGVSTLRKVGESVFIVPLANLAYVERAFGNTPEAQQCVVDALRGAIETKAPWSLWFALPAVGLLLADHGQKERAVELYALAAHNQYVGNSRWFEDVVGQHIAAVAATMSPEVVEAAQARGQALDLWETATNLLEELTEQGWGDSPNSPEAGKT